MCGRFFLRPNLDEILSFLDAEDDDVEQIVSPRWNIAPTQDILAMTATPFGQRQVGWFRWGLVPFWWKQPKLPTWINARAETIHEKPAFRDPFKRRRCLIPASGFYEWEPIPGQKQKQPHAIETGGLFAMAGIWADRARPEPMRSAAIITTDSSGHMVALHDRQPLVLEREHWDEWLDPKTPVETLSELLQPWQGDWATRPVGIAVGNVKNESGDWMA